MEQSRNTTDNNRFIKHSFSGNVTGANAIRSTLAGVPKSTKEKSSGYVSEAVSAHFHRC